MCAATLTGWQPEVRSSDNVLYILSCTWYLSLHRRLIWWNASGVTRKNLWGNQRSLSVTSRLAAMLLVLICQSLGWLRQPLPSRKPKWWHGRQQVDRRKSRQPELSYRQDAKEGSRHEQLKEHRTMMRTKTDEELERGRGGRWRVRNILVRRLELLMTLKEDQFSSNKSTRDLRCC